MLKLNPNVYNYVDIYYDIFKNDNAVTINDFADHTEADLAHDDTLLLSCNDKLGKYFQMYNKPQNPAHLLNSPEIIGFLRKIIQFSVLYGVTSYHTTDCFLSYPASIMFLWNLTDNNTYNELEITQNGKKTIIIPKFNSLMLFNKHTRISYVKPDITENRIMVCGWAY